MKCTLFILLFLAARVELIAQVDSSDINVNNAVKGASEYLQSVIGVDAFNKYIKVDYEGYRISGSTIYAKSGNSFQYVRDENYYELIFFPVINGDTIGYIKLLFDSAGKQVKNDDDDYSLTSPQLIFGYKKLFAGEFAISHKMAVETGRQKGFKQSPFLSAETESAFVNANNEVYVKVKYLWSFYENSDSTGLAILDINADNGIIEKEIYRPPMPK